MRQSRLDGSVMLWCVDDVDTHIYTFVHTLLELQDEYVPIQSYIVKPLDKPLVTKAEWQLMRRVVLGNYTQDILLTLTRNARHPCAAINK